MGVYDVSHCTDGDIIYHAVNAVCWTVLKMTVILITFPQPLKELGMCHLTSIGEVVARGYAWHGLPHMIYGLDFVIEQSVILIEHACSHCLKLPSLRVDLRKFKKLQILY